MSYYQRAVSSDRNELKELLNHGRFHLVYAPTLLFIIFSVLSVVGGLLSESINSMIIGIITSILISQIYWGRMSVKWRIKAYQFNYTFTLYREAIREQLIYPNDHFMNMFLIGPRSRIKFIRSVDEHIIRTKRMPKLDTIHSLSEINNDFRKAV